MGLLGVLVLVQSRNTWRSCLDSQRGLYHGAAHFPQIGEWSRLRGCSPFVDGQPPAPVGHLSQYSQGLLHANWFLDVVFVHHHHPKRNIVSSVAVHVPAPATTKTSLVFVHPHQVVFCSSIAPEPLRRPQASHGSWHTCLRLNELGVQRGRLASARGVVTTPAPSLGPPVERLE